MPSLEELSIEGDKENSIRGDYIIPLVSPNLRALRCSHYNPSPSNSFSAVTSFSFSARLGRYDDFKSIAALVAFLPSIPRLYDLELELYGVSYVEFDGIRPFSPCTCPSVMSFRLLLPSLTKSQDRETFIVSVLRALRMPRLETLAIAIDFEYMGKSEDECSKMLSDLSDALLTQYDPGSCASLSSLDIEITYTPPKYYYWTPPPPLDAFPRIFPTDLSKIRHVQTLTVTSCTQISFSREAHPGVEGRDQSGALCEVCFVKCKDMKIEAFSLAIQSLQDVVIWESVERIVVEECPSLNRNEALEVVGNKPLRILEG